VIGLKIGHNSFIRRAIELITLIYSPV
jgi:hypothetical protein